MSGIGASATASVSDSNGRFGRYKHVTTIHSAQNSSSCLAVAEQLLHEDKGDLSRCLNGKNNTFPELMRV
jgi:hypothetical protein